MSWNLKGRQAAASLGPATLYRVTHSHVMTRCTNKPLLWVIEQLTSVPSVGGLSGPLKKVEYFLCLVTRLLQICPPPAIIRAMLTQEHHKYVRVAALFVIRLIGHPSMIDEAVRIGLDDYRKVRMYGEENVQLQNSESVLLEDEAVTSKRPRSDDNDESMGAESIQQAHYYILCMDDLTEKLFGLSSKDNKGTFVGIALPPLVDVPVVHC